MSRHTRAAVVKAARAPKQPFKPPDAGTEIPATPPPEALQALDRAAKLANELRARRLDVQFDAGSDPVRVKIVDAGGNVVREIPVADALDLLSGDGPATILDELDRT